MNPHLHPENQGGKEGCQKVAGEGQGYKGELSPLRVLSSPEAVVRLLSEKLPTPVPSPIPPRPWTMAVCVCVRLHFCVCPACTTEPGLMRDAHLHVKQSTNQITSSLLYFVFNGPCLHHDVPKSSVITWFHPHFDPRHIICFSAQLFHLLIFCIVHPLFLTKDSRRAAEVRPALKPAQEIQFRPKIQAMPALLWSSCVPAL